MSGNVRTAVGGGRNLDGWVAGGGSIFVGPLCASAAELVRRFSDDISANVARCRATIAAAAATAIAIAIAIVVAAAVANDDTADAADTIVVIVIATETLATQLDKTPSELKKTIASRRRPPGNGQSHNIHRLADGAEDEAHKEEDEAA